MKKGLVHVYYGYGKGKTTCACGLAVRASGHGKRVLFVSFLKDFRSGEITPLKNSLDGVEVFLWKPCDKFTFKMTEAEKSELKLSQLEMLSKALEKAEREMFDIIILDELLDLIELAFISEEDTADIIINKPYFLEMVITGHEKYDKIFELSDYVTEFFCVKHPYQNGIPARDGIDK